MVAECALAISSVNPWEWWVLRLGIYGADTNNVATDVGHVQQADVVLSCIAFMKNFNVLTFKIFHFISVRITVGIRRNEGKKVNKKFFGWIHIYLQVQYLLWRPNVLLIVLGLLPIAPSVPSVPRFADESTGSKSRCSLIWDSGVGTPHADLILCGWFNENCIHMLWCTFI